MISKESRRFFQLIRDFLNIYFPKQKGCSHNTVKAYRDALNLLFDYLKKIENLKLSKVSFEKISRQTMEYYLDWLESVRNYCISTRNHRL